MTDFDKLARGFGMWIEPKPIPAPPAAEGQAQRPPHTPPPAAQPKPGQPSPARHRK